MSLLRKLQVNAKRMLSRIVGPHMVWGWVAADGRYLAHTRVSNQCVIFDKAKLDLADHVFVGHFSILDASQGLRIGEGCQIGFFTGLFTHSSHVAIRLYGRAYVQTLAKQAYFTAPVEVGDFTFVGAHAILLPGTRIGRGSIVSAYSMVNGGEYPDFSILAGQPAKVVGDTRRIDARWLQQHPELRAHYEAWAGVSN